MRDLDALNGNSGSHTTIANICMHLCKCAGHPHLFPGIEDHTLPPFGEHLVENCGKMVVLDKLLQRLEERTHCFVLFTLSDEATSDVLRIRQRIFMLLFGVSRRCNQVQLPIVLARRRNGSRIVKLRVLLDQMTLQACHKGCLIVFPMLVDNLLAHR